MRGGISDLKVKYSASFAHLLHIRPWEMDLLSVGMFYNLVKWVDDYNKQMKGSGIRG